MLRSRRGWLLSCFAGLLIFTSACSTMPSAQGLRTPPLDPARGWYFQVKYGDSLDGIARAAGQPVEKIAQANNLGNPAVLSEGLLLWIPPQSAREPAAVGPLETPAAVAQMNGPLPLAPNGEARPIQMDGASVLAHDATKTNVARASNAGRLNLRWPVDPSLCQVVPAQSGLDLVASEGTPVCAVQSGKIMHAGQLHGQGNLLLIDHGNGYISVYAHLKTYVVSEGQRVGRGQVIGYVGSTEAEKAKLYFELRYGTGRTADPVQPLAYLPRRS